MMCTSLQPKPVFAVVGGGLCGAALSLSLSRAGIVHTVYESAAAFSEIGAGITLLSNAIQALTKIEPKLAEYLERDTMWNKSEGYEHTTMIYKVGMKEMRSGERFGDKVHCLDGPPWDPVGRRCAHRARLLEELVRHVPEGTVQFKKTLVSILKSDSKYELRFADGTHAFADAVIGCDGIKSITKRFVLGEDDPALKPSFTNMYAHRGLVPHSIVESLLGPDGSNLMIHMGYNRYLVSYPVNDDLVNVGAFCSPEDLNEWESDNWVIPGTREEMLEQFKEFGEPIHKLIRCIEKTDKWAIFESSPARTYANDRVCILGDAAHASSPHHGSAAALAFEDGYILAGLLSGVDSLHGIATAFRAYDETRRPRTQAFVRSSREIGRMDTFTMDGVGDNFEKIAELANARYGWLWSFDLEKELGRGKRFMQSIDVQIV